MLRRPRNDIEYSRQRLDLILGRRRLSFNPYTVSDRRLLEIAGVTGWGTTADITQIVIVRFTRLRPVDDIRKFDGIFMTVADSPKEIFLHSNALASPVTALDSARQIRSRIGNAPIRNPRVLEKMVGKRYFVSRVIQATGLARSSRCAYQMYRLKGNIAKDAEIIRNAMCAAKIEMLERLLQYPNSAIWLDCKKGLFDYETPVRRAIDRIHRFANSPIPQDP